MSGKASPGGERGDEELIDSLYGERTEKRSAQDDGDDDLELSQLRQLRGMFAELKSNQEEPPAQGMALLMAAARQAAEERKAVAAPAQAGLWARLRAGWQAMVAHPGMAAAAAAVVVVGASGYLMSRGVKTAESTYTSDGAVHATAPAAAGAPADMPEQAPAAAPMADPAAVAPAEPVTTEAPRGAGGEGVGRTGAVPSGNASNDDGSDLQQRRPARNKAVVTPPQSTPVTGAGAAAPTDRLEERGDATRRDFAKQGEAAPPREEPAAVKKPAPSTPPSSAGPTAPSAPAPAPPPPPPPPPRPIVAEEADSAGSSESASISDEDEDTVETKPRKVESVSNQVERWFSLAQAAAKKKDCSAVRELAKRVEAENRSFYESKFRKDATIAKCL